MDKTFLKWRKANPWVVTNTQNAMAFSGRFATRQEAIDEANRRGGVVSINEPGKEVRFSEMPLL